MQVGLFNKQNLIVFLLVILVFVTMVWLMVPRLIKLCAPILAAEEQEEQKFRMYLAEQGSMGETEGFNGEESPIPAVAKPTIDPQVGSIVDGPGFEKGEVDGVGQESLSKIPSNYYFLDDGESGNASVINNLCSKSCCSAQWPTPFRQSHDPYVCANKDKYVSSNLMCNNSFQNSGLTY
jgi:hypothetical protein